MGLATATGLARLGAHVILVSRDKLRGQASREQVREQSGSGRVDLLMADLQSPDEIEALALQVLDRYPALHVLVNNAGVVNLKREVTAAGLERTFAVNHLAYFQLTNLLLDRLRSSAPARIVNVSSHGHKFGSIDLDDLQTERKKYAWMRVYGASKLANILFTYELSRRLEGSGVTANCLHPGAVGTSLGKNNGRLGRIVLPLLKPFFLSPEQGAQTSIYLASSPEVEGTSGRYYVKCRAVPSSPESHDEALARGLWDASERLVPFSAGSREMA
ncbi:MAG: SDR family oxidoreductase [Deltaproteobacteria bacterium]|nr:SDR family oxidoreductase [Deltaproteobacteria bacterium]